MKYEIMSPKQVNNMPELYEVPNAYPTAITRDGRVYNLNTNRYMTTRISVYGYELVSVNYRNEEKNYRVHRLIAMTFIGRPEHLWNTDYKDLHVNHIDGNKSNNKISNLEWCTSIENSSHALRTGLKTFEKALAKDLRTNTIKEYTDSHSCARAFGLLEATLRNHVLSELAGTKVKDYHVFKLDDGSEWPVLKDIDLSKNYNDFIQRGYWTAINVETGFKAFNHTLKDLCEKLGVNHSRVSHYQTKGIEITDGWEFKFHRRVTDGEINALGEKVSSNNRGVKIKLTNIITNEEQVFNSKNKMSISTGIPLGTVDFYKNTNRLLNDTFKITTLI